MQSRMDPVVLCARASVLAALTLFLGIAGHVSADGLLPGPVVLTLLALVTVVPCLALLARPASTLRLVVLLVGGQAAVHVVLSATAGHAGDPTGTTASGAATGARHLGASALPVVDGRRVGSLQDSYEATIGDQGMAPTLPIGHLVSDLLDHAPMMAAHLLAAALVALWLAVGERCLWTLVALAAAVACGPLRLAHALVYAGLPRAPRLPLPPAEPIDARRPAHLARSVVRRGPPLLAI